MSNPEPEPQLILSKVEFFNTINSISLAIRSIIRNNEPFTRPLIEKRALQFGSRLVTKSHIQEVIDTPIANIIDLILTEVDKRPDLLSQQKRNELTPFDKL